jgi:hypothetical protein
MGSDIHRSAAEAENFHSKALVEGSKIAQNLPAFMYCAD